MSEDSTTYWVLKLVVSSILVSSIRKSKKLHSKIGSQSLDIATAGYLGTASTGPVSSAELCTPAVVHTVHTKFSILEY